MVLSRSTFYVFLTSTHDDTSYPLLLSYFSSTAPLVLVSSYSNLVYDDNLDSLIFILIRYSSAPLPLNSSLFFFRDFLN